MKVSRNDPCPCGSGRKYKACCLPRDQARERSERFVSPEDVAESEARVAEEARRAPFWEADVVPLAGTFTETGSPGSLVIVGAAGFILGGDVLGRRPAGAGARARAVLDAVMAASRKTGVLPERLHVRDAGFAEALRPELARRGIEVSAAPLPELDEAITASLEHLEGSRAGALASSPWNWAEVEASGEELAEFHAAAAAYHRAAPWKRMGDSEALLLHFPGEDEPWAASVMGGAGVHVGLALYSDPGDVDRVLEYGGEDAAGPVLAFRGFSLSMSYDPLADLPKPMRREVTAAGWEVAGPKAYPTVMGVAVPGRRITAEHLRRVAQACRSVAEFAVGDSFELPWTSPTTGVAVDFLFRDEDEDDEQDVPEPEDLLPWPPLDVSHPAGPQGRNADPEAVLRVRSWNEVGPRELDRLGGFITFVDDGKTSRAARERQVRAAELWTEFLSQQWLPAESATEYDLRCFLYGYLVDAARVPKPVARYLTRSLRRLFAFYAGHEGIAYPWAEAVLDQLDELAVGEEDVRDALVEGGEVLGLDLALRALRPVTEVPGTPAGWAIVPAEEAAELRQELTRRWLLWHDEVVCGGITDPNDVRDVLLGRQRQWENTAKPELGGRTPKRVLTESAEYVLQLLAAELDPDPEDAKPRR